ncbi:hypothetical protein VLL09_00425 [Dehalococcoides mccartyi]|uniref:DUF551 domain-containing protein n=1 Tax=Dehalococcoides mccartyi TaxID=61435 RepID=A0AB38Z9Y1_9CHLR|nr:hypothetical protein [Dehalococcoides mccartyi]WRO07399.1 hypothetical protein VLL09_00425 [Dehalococcoides mccartyi]
MQYEPSKELIEQIASECCNAMRERGLVPADWEIITKDSQEEFKQIQVLPYVVNLPTIRKALELYENQPKWQDKPDKEGWWWYWQCDEDFCGTDIYYIHESVTGILVCDNFPLIDDLRSYSWEDIKWLYIPEPHITNPTPDGGNL